MRHKARQQETWLKAELKNPSVVVEYLAIKCLIDKVFLTVPPDTTIRIDRGKRWRGSKAVASRFFSSDYPRYLLISSSDVIRHYTFTGADTRWASSTEERWDSYSAEAWRSFSAEEHEDASLQSHVGGVLNTRPYSAHPVWNSVVKRGPMKIPELEAVDRGRWRGSKPVASPFFSSAYSWQS